MKRINWPEHLPKLQSTCVFGKACPPPQFEGSSESAEKGSFAHQTVDFSEPSKN
jgi:hypothetical protein